MNRSPVTIAVAVRKLLNDLTYPEKIEDLVNGLTENLRLGHTGSFVNQHCGAGAAVLVTTVGSYDVLRSQIGLGEGPHSDDEQTDLTTGAMSPDEIREHVAAVVDTLWGKDAVAYIASMLPGAIARGRANRKVYSTDRNPHQNPALQVTFNLEAIRDRIDDTDPRTEYDQASVDTVDEMLAVGAQTQKTGGIGLLELRIIRDAAKAYNESAAAASIAARFAYPSIDRSDRENLIVELRGSQYARARAAAGAAFDGFFKELSHLVIDVEGSYRSLRQEIDIDTSPVDDALTAGAPTDYVTMMATISSDTGLGEAWFNRVSTDVINRLQNAARPHAMGYRCNIVVIIDEPNTPTTTESTP